MTVTVDLGSKVADSHLGRDAYVYVRQSTLTQVREHTESLERQYELAFRAQALGWARRQVIVIDDDLGRSGAEATRREQYTRSGRPMCRFPPDAGVRYGISRGPTELPASPRLQRHAHPRRRSPPPDGHPKTRHTRQLRSGRCLINKAATAELQQKAGVRPRIGRGCHEMTF